MEAKHTPGPWAFIVEPTECEGVNVRFSIQTADGDTIYIASGQSQEHLQDRGSGIVLEAACVANARLIAAAPDLLEACETLLFELVAGPAARDEVIASARAAINKATGA